MHWGRDDLRYEKGEPVKAVIGQIDIGIETPVVAPRRFSHFRPHGQGCCGPLMVSEATVIRHSGSGLWGPGRLIQSNASAALIAIRGAQDVRIRDLTLTRSPERLESSASAVTAVDCDGLSLENLRVLDNRSAVAGIRLDRCRHCEIVRCLVRNYMTVFIDDRTGSPHYAYAFHCIDGTAIAVCSCKDVLLQGNCGGAASFGTFAIDPDPRTRCGSRRSREWWVSVSFRIATWGASQTSAK